MLLPFGAAMEEANAAILSVLADCEIVIDDLWVVRAVWRDPSRDAALGMISAASPVASVLAGHCPPEIERGMPVRRSGDDACYRIMSVDPDGSGMADITLERIG